MRSTKNIKNCRSSLWTCLHHMVIIISQNKITDRLMILAWAFPFKLLTCSAVLFQLYFSSYGAGSDEKILLFCQKIYLLNWFILLAEHLPQTLLFSSVIYFKPNPLTAKLFNLNFHPLEVVSRWRDPQLQVSENYLDLTKWRSTLFKSCWLIFIFNMFKRWYLYDNKKWMKKEYMQHRRLKG